MDKLDTSVNVLKEKEQSCNWRFLIDLSHRISHFKAIKSPGILLLSLIKTSFHLKDSKQNMFSSVNLQYQAHTIHGNNFLREQKNVTSDHYRNMFH